MFRRPKPKDSENDLLSEQEQFLASRQGAAAATVVRRPDKRKADDEPKETEEQLAGNTTEDVSGVLSEVKERDTSHFFVMPPEKRCAAAFPKVMRIDKQMLSDGKQTQSLFARQMKKERSSMDIDSDAISTTDQPFGYQSIVIDGSGLNDERSSALAQEIHEENVKRLTSMSEKEILIEQQQLLQTLDPNLLAFLKQKHKEVPNSALDRRSEHNVKLPVANQQNEAPAISHPKVIPAECSSGLPASLPKAVVSDDSLPIKPSDVKKWPHMDIVESEKLAWTSNLPPLKPVIPKEGYSARFDLEGMLVAREQDIPTTKGLHHHGEEPEVPGYTLEELFQYSRSSVVQQRVLGLQVLTNVLKLFKKGMYDECLQTSLLPQLLDAGIVMLLRWALDDNTEASVSAAVLALAAVFVSEPDEKSLDHVFSWHLGYEVPLLLPHNETDDQNSEEKLQELTDAEIMKLDAVKGLLRMDILPRFAYVLETIKPPPEAVFAILEILICIARHSVDGSIAILKNNKLMQCILTNFLPKSWLLNANPGNPVGSVYGVPLFQAVKLLRVLAASGRSIATNLIYKHRVLESVMCYISIDPSATDLPTEEALYLGLESYRVWRIFLLYGLGAEEYLEMFPLLMRQLHYYQMAEVGKAQRYDCDYGSELLGLLEAAVRVAGSEAFLSTTSSGCSGDHVVPPPINWSHVASLQQPVQMCAAKYLTLLMRADRIEYWELKFTASCLNFLSAYLSEFSKQSFFQVVDVLEQIELFYTKNIIPFCRSSVFNNLLQKISYHSSLLCSLKSGCERDPPTLCSLGSLTWGGELSPVLHPDSPFHFLTSMLNLMIVLNKVHRNLEEEIPRLFLMCPNVVSYTCQVGQTNSHLAGDWWSRYEIHFLWHLVKLSSVKCKDPKVLQHFHHVAVGLLPKFLVGDSQLIYDLLSSVVFSTEFLPEQHDLDFGLCHLSLEGNVALQSATRQEINVSRMQLVNRTMQTLSSIRTTYLDVYCAHVRNRRNRTVHIPYHCDYIVIRSRCTNILPDDWLFLPIMQLYHTTKNSGQSLRNDVLASGELLLLTHCLQWVHLLICWKPLLVRLSFSLKLYHLGCIFLLSSDAFLNPTIHGYIQALLNDAVWQNPVDENKERKLFISEKTAFRDFYLQLLAQYEAVSYGDQLFGTFVLLPLQQRYDRQLRSDLWTEHQEALRFLTLTPQQFPLPLDKYLYPLEENEQLILAYCQALLSGLVTQQRCPLLYLVAVHHIHNYLVSINHGEMETKLKMIEQISRTPNQSVCQHLLHYAQPEVGSELGFALLPNLPNNIRNLTDRIPRP